MVRLAALIHFTGYGRFCVNLPSDSASCCRTKHNTPYTHFAEHSEDGFVPIQQIAAARKIPAKFLEAILLELRRASILGSRAGKGGGYYLLKKPSEITLVEVIRATDGPVALLPCVSKKFYEPCRICPYEEKSCELRHLFFEVRDATLKVLEGKTVSDIAAKSRPAKKAVK